MQVEELSRCLPALRAGLASKRVLVVGDLMLDRYLWGNVRRISPEAPVPVVRLVRQTEMAGGAGNVVRNLVGLGVGVAVAGGVGADADGDRLVGLLAAGGTDVDAVVRLGARPTITKSRIIGEHQQMLRLDVEDSAPLPEADARRCLDAALAQLALRPDAVLLSDYEKGLLTPEVCQALIAAARRLGIPVLVDPKGRDFEKYRGATALTPNRAELAVACGLSGDDLETLSDAGRSFLARLDLHFIALTLSELGIRLLEPEGVHQIPTMAREVFDVSGAGDTVIATLAAGLVAGLAVRDAVAVANLAAGVVVGKLGTAPIVFDEIARALAVRQRTRPDGAKSLRPDDLARRVAEWRRRGDRIVFTNGCFDILHAGHVGYLEAARDRGDRLIVGLNSDASVRGLKGPSRPVNDQDDRARLLEALACVDAVVVFDNETPLDLIVALRPDVLVKGGDYTEPRIVGAPEVRAWGGEVAIIPLLEGRSTTRLLDRLQERAHASSPLPTPHLPHTPARHDATPRPVVKID